MARMQPSLKTTKAYPLMICAMKQTCRRAENCVHAWTHRHDHTNCFNTPSSPKKMCTSYRIRAVLAGKPLITEIGKVNSALINLGWCCEWDYWQKHKTNEIHFLMGKYSVGDLAGKPRDDFIYRTSLYTPKGTAKPKASWGTISSRDRDRARVVRDAPIVPDGNESYAVYIERRDAQRRENEASNQRHVDRINRLILEQTSMPRR